MSDEYLEFSHNLCLKQSLASLNHTHLFVSSRRPTGSRKHKRFLMPSLMEQHVVFQHGAPLETFTAPRQLTAAIHITMAQPNDHINYSNNLHDHRAPRTTAIRTSGQNIYQKAAKIKSATGINNTMKHYHPNSLVVGNTRNGDECVNSSSSKAQCEVPPLQKLLVGNRLIRQQRNDVAAIAFQVSVIVAPVDVLVEITWIGIVGRTGEQQLELVSMAEEEAVQPSRFTDAWSSIVALRRQLPRPCLERVEWINISRCLVLCAKQTENSRKSVQTSWESAFETCLNGNR